MEETWLNVDDGRSQDTAFGVYEDLSIASHLKMLHLDALDRYLFKKGGSKTPITFCLCSLDVI